MGHRVRSLILLTPALPEKKDERYGWARQSGLLATIPFLMAVPPVVGLLVGRYLDNRFDTDPIFTIVFPIFVFVAAVREVASVLKKANAGNDGKKSDDEGEQ
jgi:ATP synthase protein I